MEDQIQNNTPSPDLPTLSSEAETSTESIELVQPFWRFYGPMSLSDLIKRIERKIGKPVDWVGLKIEKIFKIYS